MDDAVARTARAAAGQLAGELGGRLPGDVEAILHARDDAPAAEQYVLDPVSLASLVVSVAGLAWQVYRDLRSKSDAPAREVVERRVRVAVRESATAAPAAQRDRVIEVVVSDVMDSDQP